MSASPAVLVTAGVLALCLLAAAVPGGGPGGGAAGGALGRGGGEATSGSVRAALEETDRFAPIELADLLPARVGATAGFDTVAVPSSLSVAVGVGSDTHQPLDYRPPVVPAVLLVAFDAPEERWDAGHRGVDLVAAPGDPVRAPTDGVVVFTGMVVDRGVVTLLHPDGLRSSLEPVAGALDVGVAVAAGDVIGTVRGGSHCGASCVHWGVRRGERYLDPLGLLSDAGPTVLLPVP